MTTQTFTSSVISASEIKDSVLTRVLSVIPMAMIITASIFILMERLVHMADAPLDDSTDVIFPQVVWEDTEIETRKEEKIEKPPEPMEQPEVLEREANVEEGVDITLPPSGFTPEKVTGYQVAYNSSLPVAQYMGVAKYPTRALNRSVEGFVDVLFDVTEFGATDNVRVLYAEPEGFFEKAALQAVSRWRFQPKMEEDKPVRFEGMKNRIRFQLENS
ncbi:protein TonB [Alteromonadaceae bacterium Bs31]|nr:protein TonB [Alteromonadaceae bacterium Bs31]